MLSKKNTRNRPATGGGHTCHARAHKRDIQCLVVEAVCVVVRAVCCVVVYMYGIITCRSRVCIMKRCCCRPLGFVVYSVSSSAVVMNYYSSTLYACGGSVMQTKKHAAAASASLRPSAAAAAQIGWVFFKVSSGAVVMSYCSSPL